MEVIWSGWEGGYELCETFKELAFNFKRNM